MILGLLLACGPDGPDLEAALAAVRSGNDAALKLELDKATDPLARDMMLLELATAEPTARGKLCAAVSTTYAREKCVKVIGRPHLQGPGR